MKTEYKYIHFRKIEQKPKTAVYQCINTNHDDLLGIVEWYPPWRQYCFAPEYRCVFNNGCLRDIINFIGQLDEERKKLRHEGPALKEGEG